MRCPFCGNVDTQVKDSRPAEDHVAIRRRRFCPACGGRFTTYERVQLRDLVVIKTNGRREEFDRDKLERSVKISLQKRPIERDRTDQKKHDLHGQRAHMKRQKIGDRKPDQQRYQPDQKAELQRTEVGLKRYAKIGQATDAALEDLLVIAASEIWQDFVFVIVPETDNHGQRQRQYQK